MGTDTWQGVTANAVTVAYATEGRSGDRGSAPTFTQPELVAKKAHGFVAVSIEMMQDRSDIASELTTLFSEAKDTYEEGAVRCRCRHHGISRGRRARRCNTPRWPRPSTT